MNQVEIAMDVKTGKYYLTNNKDKKFDDLKEAEINLGWLIYEAEKDDEE